MSAMDHRKLVHLITDQDRRDSKRPGYNIYALAIMLGAAQNAADEAESYGPERAFARNFTPSRSNRAIAKKLGLNLTVERGRWEYAVEPAPR